MAILNMKKTIFTFLLLLIFLSGESATYYIKNAGNDANTGLSDAQAWTYTKLSSFVPAAGDKILFNRGETFTGLLMFGRSATVGSPVTYGAYGTGAKPIITTMATLGSWTLHSGKIYKTTGVPANCDVVTIDGTSVSMGKYPQNGEASFESNTFVTKTISSTSDYSGTVAGTIRFTTSTAHSLTTGTMVTIRNTSSYDGYYSATVINSTQFYITKTYVSNQGGTLVYNSTITDNQLTGSPSWTGAEVVIWKSNWTIDRGSITNHSTTTLTYVSGSGYAVQSSGGMKYYIQRSLAACTYQGAWYCDGTNFYMYFENNDPNNFVVKAGTSDYTVYMSSKNYNILRDVEIQGGNLAAIYNTGSTGFSFKNSTLKNAGLLGITSTSSTTVTTIDSCAISYVNGSSISINSANSYIGHTTIDRSGQFAGMGAAGGGSHYGIWTKGANNITEYNTITNTGYIPIFWESSGAICRYNIVDTYPTLLLNDGGGIYTFESVSPQTAKKCYGNFVANSTANGLYSDGIANNVEFYNNTVYNVDKWAMHMNMPTNNSVHDNIFYDFGLAGIDITNQTLLGVYYTASGNTISNNILVQKAAVDKFYSLQDARANNILSFGTSDYNTFIADSTVGSVFYNLYVLPSFHSTSYTFASWKTLTSKESFSSLVLCDISTITFLYNATHASQDMAITGAKIDLNNVVYQGTVTVPARSSIVLFPTTVTNPTGLKNAVKAPNGKPMKMGTKYLVL